MSLTYWKHRCIAAEKFISESPCDPDITKKQLEAYQIWQHIKNVKDHSKYGFKNYPDASNEERMKLIAKVKRMYKNGESQRDISKALKISKTTVHRYIVYKN